MSIGNRRVFAALIAWVVMGGAAYAQIDSGGRTALENSRGGAVLGRNPGQLVNAGVQRAREFGRGANIGVDVTEQAQSSQRSVLISQALDLVFLDLNSAIDLFHRLILARGGRGPTLPSRASTTTQNNPARVGTNDSTGSINQADLAGLDLGGLDLGSLLNQIGGR